MVNIRTRAASELDINIAGARGLGINSIYLQGMSVGQSDRGIGAFISSLTRQSLPEAIREELQEWLRSSEQISVLLGGRTGGGKSTLVNSLLGEEVAEEGAEPDPSTAEVTCYERSLNDVLVKVWDSPGLQDGTGNEERYLADIAAKCGHVDLFLFCINVGDATRFNSDSPEVNALVTLTRKLGKGIWDHALVALTFANRLGRFSDEFRSAQLRKDTEKLKELFQRKVCEWEKFIRRILLKDLQLSPDQVDKLKIVPTGSRRVPSLPDRRHWLSTFWLEALRSTHPRAQPALLKMNETRIIENPEMLDEKFCTEYSKDQSFITCEYASNVGKLLCDSEDLGSKVGLSFAQTQELKLKERMVLEQFAIMKLIHEQHEEQGLPPRSCEGSEEGVLKSIQHTPLSELALGLPPKGTPGVSANVEAANDKRKESESYEPQGSVCGGRFH